MVALEWEREILRVIGADPQLQTWSGHLDIRMPELRRLDSLAGLRPTDRLLEIGCGNGLASAYFSRSVSSVVASDLPAVDHSAHAIGLEKPRRLLDALGVGNCELAACSAEAMPFPDAAFDVVLSMFSLEHIPDRLRCLAECRRVLKPGGRLLITVPAAAGSLLYPLSFYHDFFGRVIQRVRPPKASKPGASGIPPDSAAGSSAGHLIRDWSSFRKAYPHFPLPEPHGAYPSYWHELAAQTPGRWVRLVETAGFGSVEGIPLSVLPRNTLAEYLGSAGRKLSEALVPYDVSLSDRRALRPFAQFLLILAIRPIRG